MNSNTELLLIITNISSLHTLQVYYMCLFLNNPRLITFPNYVSINVDLSNEDHDFNDNLILHSDYKSA